ncbi:MAG: ABC transporter permease [Actinomycetota bacterium]|nr:ABC transporter permease [Actinomycetota bacterium]
MTGAGLSAVVPITSGKAERARRPAGPGKHSRTGGHRPRGRRVRRAAGLAPFLAYLAVFLVVPSVSVVSSAFETVNGGFTWSNVSAALQGTYLVSFEKSLELSALSAVVSAVLGTVVAVALASTTSATARRVVTSASAVFANTGGLPLAFAFIASLGNFGIVTKVLAAMGWNPYDHGFSLYTLTGLVVVYCYFLLPLMVLVMLPAVDGLRREWFEAASLLGARRGDVWRHVGVPVLAPAFLAALMVLFTDAFAAYATAEALTNGAIPIVPIQIGTLIQGNVLAGQQNVGDALGLGMIVVVACAALLYARLQRRAARWQR